MENTNILMVVNMKECGKMINNMVQELKHGQIKVNMKDNMLKEEKKEKGILINLKIKLET